jgi:hypothetical protein
MVILAPAALSGEGARIEQPKGIQAERVLMRQRTHHDLYDGLRETTLDVLQPFPDFPDLGRSEGAGAIRDSGIHPGCGPE